MTCPECGGGNFNWAKRCAHCDHHFSTIQAPGAAAERGLRIPTPGGRDIRLTPATSRQIEAFRAYWSLGLQEWPASHGYGLVCRRQDREAMAVKFQQVDVPVAVAPFVSFQNRALIALALRGYLERGHHGLIMPGAYTRPKGDDRVETGIAYLVGPDLASKSSSGERPDDTRWDAAIGAGGTAMVGDFAREIGRVMDQVPQGTAGNGVSIGRPYFLTMEVQPTSALGSIDIRMAMLDSDVLVTMPEPASRMDSAWDFVSRAGFTSLSHLPLAPVELRQDGSLNPL